MLTVLVKKVITVLLKTVVTEPSKRVITGETQVVITERPKRVIDISTKAFCNIKSLMDTCRKHGLNHFAVLQDLFSGKDISGQFCLQ